MEFQLVSRRTAKKVSIEFDLSTLRLRSNYCHNCRQLVDTYLHDGWRFHLRCKHERCVQCRCAVGPEVYFELQRFEERKKRPILDLENDVIYLNLEED